MNCRHCGEALDQDIVPIAEEIVQAAREFVRAYESACDAERRRRETVAAEKYAILKRALVES